MSFLFNDIPAIPAVERFVDLSFEVSERIIRLLNEKGMSQRDLAIKLGKKDSEISKWLAGNHNFTLRTIAAIETVLDKKFVKVEGLGLEYTVIDGINQVSTIPMHSDTNVTLKENYTHHGSKNLMKLGGKLSDENTLNSVYHLDYNPFDSILSGSPTSK